MQHRNGAIAEGHLPRLSRLLVAETRLPCITGKTFMTVQMTFNTLSLRIQIELNVLLRNRCGSHSLPLQQ